MSTNFHTGLFACFDNFGIFCCGTFCLPYLFGKNAEAGLSESCCLNCLLYPVCCAWCWWGGRARTKLRTKYGLARSPCADWLVHLFCSPCAVCQEAREIHWRRYNVWPDFGPQAAHQYPPQYPTPQQQQYPSQYASAPQYPGQPQYPGMAPYPGAPPYPGGPLPHPGGPPPPNPDGSDGGMYPPPPQQNPDGTPAAPGGPPPPGFPPPPLSVDGSSPPPLRAENSGQPTPAYGVHAETSGPVGRPRP